MFWSSIKKRLRTRKVIVLVAIFVLFIIAGVTIPRSFVTLALSKLGLASAPLPAARPAKGISPVSYRNLLRTLNAANNSRDTNAENILKAAFEALGGARAVGSINDSVIEGKLDIPGVNGESGDIVVKIRGFSQVRTETRIGSKTFVQATDRGRGHADLDGNIFDLPAEYGLFGRTNLLPLFGHFSRFLNSATGISLMGSVNIEGYPNPSHVILVSEPGADFSVDAKGTFGSGLFFIYVDSKTFLINRVEYSIGALDTSSARGLIRVDYSDYRQVGPLLSPHRVVETFDEQGATDVRITNITTNRGLTDKDFEKVEKSN